MTAFPAATSSRFRNLCLICLVVICGWVLMMLEMLGARLLAPSFGTGIYVWGSVIGVFLLALSVGYTLGGVLSKRFPEAAGLALLLLPCAIWIGLLPWMHRPVNDWLFEWWVVSRGGSEQWGSLFAAIILFLVPSILLGSISPYAIRLAATDIDSVGQRAGMLYAISTLGSFLGCMITSFYLIAWMGMDRILRVHALILLLATAVFCGMWRLLSPAAKGHQP